MSIVVAGVDVGGHKKGFHAVVLRDGEFLARCAERCAVALALWCREQGASVIGIDAPCTWSAEPGPRPCERALMAEGIYCFSTPTEAAARRHPTNYYGWMLAGAALYDEVRRTHGLYVGKPIASGRRTCCFETFPHAIACALAGRILRARDKRVDRSALLKDAGVLLPAAAGIDTIDAALCALTAYRLALGSIKHYGEHQGGFIVTPRMP